MAPIRTDSISRTVEEGMFVDAVLDQDAGAGNRMGRQGDQRVQTSVPPRHVGAAVSRGGPPLRKSVMTTGREPTHRKAITATVSTAKRMRAFMASP